MGDFAVARIVENGKIRRKPSPLQGELRGENELTPKPDYSGKQQHRLEL